MKAASTRLTAVPAIVPDEPKRSIYVAHDGKFRLHRLEFTGPDGSYAEVQRDSDEPDVVFVTRGRGQAVSGNLAGSSFDVAPSQAFRTTFVPYGVDARVVFAVNRTVSALLFQPMHLAALVAGRCQTNIAPVLFAEDDRLARLVGLMEAEILAPGFASTLLLDGLSRAIATLLARLDVASIGAEADRIYIAPWKLRRVLEYIEANLHREVTLQDLAGSADLSTFHFSRVFKLATGVSPYRYVRDRRLVRSRMLLAEGALDIAELALACGFANQSHFTAAFTKASGISPNRFRRQCR
jgi:AraC-like DNA-binding protein